MRRLLLIVILAVISYLSSMARTWNFGFNSIDTVIEAAPDYVSKNGGVINLYVGIDRARYYEQGLNIYNLLMGYMYPSGIVVSNVLAAGYDGDCLIFSAELEIPALPFGDNSGTISFQGRTDYDRKTVTQGGVSLQGTVTALNHERMLPSQHFDIDVANGEPYGEYTLYKYVNGTYNVIQTKYANSSGHLYYYLSGPGTYVVGRYGNVFCDDVIIAYESDIFSQGFFHAEFSNPLILPKSGGSKKITLTSVSKIDSEVMELYLGVLESERPALWDGNSLSISVSSYGRDTCSVVLQLASHPNFGESTREWNTDLYVDGSTLKFSQNGGAILKPYVFTASTDNSRSVLHAISNGSQLDVQYTMYRNGNYCTSKQGNGHPVDFTCPDTTGIYTFDAYYTDHDQVFVSLDMVGEVTMPVFIPPVSEDDHQEDGNWVRTYTYTSDNGHYFVDATYYNGLGYPEQQVLGHASGHCLGNIITPVVYDSLMRADAMIMLPYSTDGVDEVCMDPDYEILQPEWYLEHFGTNGEIAWSQTDYEKGARGRVLKSRKAGKNHSDANKWITHSYRFNRSGEVPKISNSEYYPAASLIAHKITDEDGVSVTEFRDMDDRLITTRYFRTPGDSTSYYDVKYNYNKYGKLSSISTGYSYQYDEFGRTVQNWQPLGGRECYLYDNEDRIVYKVQTRAHFLYEYDDYGRPVRTWIKPGSWFNYDHISDSLSTVPTPQEFDGTLLSETFWGEYPSGAPSFEPDGDIVSLSDVSGKTRGLKTYERQLIMHDEYMDPGQPEYVEKAYYYDYCGNVIQQVERTHLGTIFRRNAKYNRLGKPVLVKERHDFGNGHVDSVMFSYTYDHRGRGFSESVRCADSTLAEVYRMYDDLGRVGQCFVGIGDDNHVESYAYNLHGNLSALSGDGYTQRLFYENSPSGASNHKRFDGKISSISWTETGSRQDTLNILHYDGRGRLQNATTVSNPYDLPVETIAYQDNGKTLILNRYSSDGNMCEDLLFSTLGEMKTPLVTNYMEAGEDYSFEYDERSNLTLDELTGFSAAYTLLDRPSRIEPFFGGPVYFTWLADGTKVAQLGDYDEGYDYIGSFRYRRGDDTLRLESIPFSKGRIRFDSGGNILPEYHATDYLGSIRRVMSETGVDKTYDYVPYGSLVDEFTNTPHGNEYLFQGKEMIVFEGFSLYDFGARFYNPRTLMWLTRDPLAEERPDLSPYVFCAADPVNMVDPDGRSTYVIMRGDGTYQVTDEGDPDDGDDNIYVGYRNTDGSWHNSGVSIGHSATPYSFYDTKNNCWAEGAVIDLCDTSGARFMSDLLDNLLPLGVYMEGAKKKHIFDFKRTNGGYPFPEGQNADNIYRGMLIDINGNSVIASARDVGNIVAGYYAGANGIPWIVSRAAFDIYQNQGNNDITFEREEKGTRVAQKLGFHSATSETSLFTQYKNLRNSKPSLFLFAYLNFLPH